MVNSILKTIKKMIGIDENDTNFDTDIIIHINTVFMILHQLGVGPASAFAITGDTETWNDFTQGDPNLEGIKTYVYLKVKLVFDPPQNSFLVSAIKDQIADLEWRLNVQVEGGD